MFIIKKGKTMEEQKEKFDWVRLVAAIVIFLAIIAVASGITWYLMNKNANDTKATNDKAVKILESTIEELKKDDKAIDTIKTARAADIILTDQDELTIRTLKQSQSTQGEYSAVHVTKNDGTWAITIPIPVVFSATTGYSIPGRGGVSYLWQIIDEMWVYVGSGGEGGWNDAVKAKYKEIPKTKKAINIINNKGRDMKDLRIKNTMHLKEIVNQK
jgi:hypothetical protein